MNNQREKIHQYIKCHESEIISDLKELVKIPSVRGVSEENAPFGKACSDVLEFVNNKYKNSGFKTEINQNGGYLLSFFGESERTIGIFSHADVVPVSDDWILTSPFEPIEKDGYIVGRGAFDNKSGVIASLYCAKMLKELKLPFKSRFMCFTGANEEAGMGDIKNYLSEHKKPDFSIVPDSAFPIYRGNKGRIAFSLKSKDKLRKGVLLSGGTGTSVIGEAKVVLPFEKKLCDEIVSHANDRVTIEYDNENIILYGAGIARHSALPEGSLSGVYLLTDVLRRCTTLPGEEREIYKSLCDMSGCHYGEYFGIKKEDDEFGNLTCVLTKVATDEEGFLSLDFNIRHGISANKDFILSKINGKLTGNTWEKPEVDSHISEPHSLPADNIFVKRLIGVYDDFTNSCNSESYINAGGTYRQYLKNAVETGTMTIWGAPEGLPEGHGGAHQPDECINIKGLLEAIEILMLMILECDEIIDEK